jgi:hypothetical protein
MIYEKNGIFIKVTRTENRLVRTKGKNALESVLNDNSVEDIVEARDIDTWTQVLPTLKTMTGNEMLTRKYRYGAAEYARVLERIGGYGELSLYALSINTESPLSDSLKFYNRTRTEYELKKDGWSVMNTTPEMTRKEAEREFGIRIVA